MRKALVTLTALLLVSLVTLAALELVLRMFPSLVSVSVIDRMHPDLRTEIAARLNLPVQEDYAIIPSAERMDRGPDIYMLKPERAYFRPVDLVDRAAGAVDTIHSDARGFCNPAHLVGMANFDVVTVGGSVPNCASVDGDHVFSAELGKLLPASSYNLAVYAVGPYEYNEILSRYAGELEPRVVIFAISEANDLRDSMRYLDHLAGKGVEKKGKLGGAFRYSYVLGFMKAGIESLIKQASATVRPNFRYSIKSGGESVAMNLTNGDSDELKSARDLDEGKLSADLYAPPLKRFVELSKRHGFVPVVVYVPAAYSVYQPGISFEDPSIAPILAEYSEAQRDWLTRNADLIGYRFVDPTERLRQIAIADPHVSSLLCLPRLRSTAAS